MHNINDPDQTRIGAYVETGSGQRATGATTVEL